MSTRFSISLLLSMMVSAVLFGIGATTILSIPSCRGSSTDRHCVELRLRSNCLMGYCAEAASKILT
jgi:hypothetical protein